MLALISSIATLAILATLLPSPAVAQTLIHDINQRSRGSYPLSPLSLKDGRIVFTARTTQSGRDLWITDGTPSGTKRIRDFEDPAGHPLSFASGERIYYIVRGGDLAEALWSIELDGSAPEPVPGIASQQIRLHIQTEQAVFLSDDAATLWKIPAGEKSATPVDLSTPSVEDVRHLSGFISLRDSIYFRAITESDSYEIWRMSRSGQVDGPVYQSPDGLSRMIPASNGLLFFESGEGMPVRLRTLSGSGHEPITLFDELVPPNEGYDAFEVGRTDSFALIFVSPYESPAYLIISDGSVDGTLIIREVDNLNWPSIRASTDTHVFFSLKHPELGQELWVSDGTAEGTAVVKDIYPGSGSSDPDFLRAAHDRVYFSARDPEFGTELWTSDGTQDGTYMLADILTGPAGSMPGPALPIGDGLVVRADDGSHGTEPWYIQKDGDFAFLVRDIRQNEITHTSLEYNSRLIPAGDNVLFSADDGMAGTELWISSGNETGTSLLFDLAPGPVSGYPAYQAPVGSGSVWTAYPDTGERRRRERAEVLFFIDHGEYSITELTDFDGRRARVHGAVTGESEVLFTADFDSIRSSIWITDSTPGGTRAVHQAAPADYPVQGVFGYIDGKWLISTSRQDAGAGVFTWDGDWLSDAPLTSDVTPEPIIPLTRVYLDGDLAFLDTAGGIWFTDATTSGTHLIRPRSGGKIASNKMVRVGNRIIWFENSESSLDLYASDGTEAGTRLVSDAIPNMNGASLESLVSDGSRAYLGVSDHEGRTDIWTTDGTAEGTTRMLSASSYVYDDYIPVAFHEGRFLFGYATEAQGVELWISDGTVEGTILLADLNPGPAGSYPENGALIGDMLVFSAEGERTGRELWSIDLSTVSVGSEDPIELPGDVTVGAVWPNPVRSSATLDVDAPVSQQVTVDAFDVLGRLIGRVYTGLTGGESGGRIEINAAGWAAGMYLLHVDGETFSTTRTLIRAR